MPLIVQSLRSVISTTGASTAACVAAAFFVAARFLEPAFFFAVAFLATVFFLAAAFFFVAFAFLPGVPPLAMIASRRIARDRRKPRLNLDRGPSVSHF